jgi:F-type H+-transporting ATPase subunit b
MAEFLLLVLAVAIVVAIAWGPFQRNVIGALDARAERIRRELDEARRLREEAESMLAEYRTRLDRGEERAREIMEHARVEAERQTARMQEEMEAGLRRRTEQATDRIAQEEARALQQLRAQAAELAVRATRRLLADRVDSRRQTALIDDAIAQLGRRLH